MLIKQVFVCICRLWLNEQQPWHYYLLCEAAFVYIFFFVRLQ